MKKLITLMTVCSLALAGAVMAQAPSPEESQAPGKKPKADKKAPAEVKPQAPQAPKTEAPAVAPKTEAPAVKEPAETKPKPHSPKHEAPAVKEPSAAAQPPPAANEPPPPPKVDKRKAPKNQKPASDATAPETNPAAEQPAASVPPVNKKEKSAESRKADKKAPDANAKPTPAAAASTAPEPTKPTKPIDTPAPSKPGVSPAASVASTTPAASAAASTAPAATAPAASVAPSVAQTSPAASVNPAVAAAKKPDPQKVEQIRQRTATFTAQPRPDRVPPVTFSAGFRLPGVETWSGPRYEVYRSYRPERHDRGYYSSRYQRVELIAGGYYYFHNNYWYPAWGYDSGHEYYAYDAPIYAGKRALPPDKVIAEVQAVLQEMGYYKGEVDGLIGPLTREALTGYQRDTGLVATAVIDEPTLDALGMS